jgi:hypothetical protein
MARRKIKKCPHGKHLAKRGPGKGRKCVLSR